MRRFTGRVVVLTGVGREGQVGEVVAHAFGEEGGTLALVDRDREQVEQRAEALREAGFDATAYQCDLTNPDQVAELATAVGARHGARIDALVNMAGGFAMTGPVADSVATQWQRQFDINLTTAYLATRFFLPMLRSGGGAIVFFGSASALPESDPGKMSAYAASKAGVIALARAVSSEERDAHVRANVLAPTTIRTATNVESMGAGIRYVEREDVAAAVLFLCSEAARAVTGQILRLS